MSCSKLILHAPLKRYRPVLFYDALLMALQHAFGTPIQKVSEAKSVIAMKRGRGAGPSGVESDPFVHQKTSMLFGDAKQSLIAPGLEVKNA
jgi:hypothetical protein